MSKNRIDMDYISEKFEGIKRNVKNTIGSNSNLENELVTSDIVEKIRKTVQNGMYATKEDYMELIARLEGMRAELTYMTSILEDGEGYENLRAEVKAHQEEQSREISKNINSLKSNQEDKTKLMFDEISVLKTNLDSLLDELKEQNKNEMHEIQSSLDDRLDIFKEKFAEEVKLMGDDFRKELLADIEKKNGANKRSINVVTWLGIINAVFLIALLYFVINI